MRRPERAHARRPDRGPRRRARARAARRADAAVHRERERPVGVLVDEQLARLHVGEGLARRSQRAPLTAIGCAEPQPERRELLVLDVEHRRCRSGRCSRRGRRSRPPRRARAACSSVDERRPGRSARPRRRAARPRRARAATGAKMSRPWNVADAGSRRCGESADVDRLDRAAEARDREATAARCRGRRGSGPSSATRTATARRSPPTSRVHTARWTPGGQYGSARRSTSAPERTSWRGMPWVRSMTAAPGAIRAITPWQTPTKSSARP